MRGCLTARYPGIYIAPVIDKINHAESTSDERHDPRTQAWTSIAPSACLCYEPLMFFVPSSPLLLSLPAPVYLGGFKTAVMHAITRRSHMPAISVPPHASLRSRHHRQMFDTTSSEMTQPSTLVLTCPTRSTILLHLTLFPSEIEASKAGSLLAQERNRETITEKNSGSRTARKGPPYGLQKKRF